MVIYGHNRSGLFADLKKVRPNDIITVELKNGEQHLYQIDTSQVVQPDEIEHVLPTEHEQLTLYTCTGFFDSERLILIARPVKVISK